jgi:hypothetical protein
MSKRRTRFWVETICGIIGASLFVLTLISRQWIEIVFGVDPDGGSGALEFGIALLLLGVAVGSSLLALREWRRPLAVGARPITRGSA